MLRNALELVWNGFLVPDEKGYTVRHSTMPKGGTGVVGGLGMIAAIAMCVPGSIVEQVAVRGTMQVFHYLARCVPYACYIVAAVIALSRLHLLALPLA